MALSSEVTELTARVQRLERPVLKEGKLQPTGVFSQPEQYFICRMILSEATDITLSRTEVLGSTALILTFMQKAATLSQIAKFISLIDLSEGNSNGTES